MSPALPGSLLRRVLLFSGALLCVSTVACESTVTFDFFPRGAPIEEPPPGAAGAAGAPTGGGEPPEPPALIVEGVRNLSRESSGARACADGGDAVGYPVARLEASLVELALPPAEGCLQPGDEVLLINLQGATDGLGQVGSYELSKVHGVSGKRVMLAAPKRAFFGRESGSDEGVGTSPGEQRVVVQRVPVYSRLEVRAGAELTADAWNGQLGGVLALRVLGESLVDGRVHMDARGYRGGPTTEPAESPGTQGESLAGLGATATFANLGGGGGGIGDQTRLGCQQDGNPGGGGGHVTPGRSAVVMDLCEGAGAGAGGQRYDLPGRLFLGSGGGSAGTDNIRVDNPPGGAGGAGGGIVWLLSDSITGRGAISARGAAGVGDPPGTECLGYSVVDCYDHTGPGGGGAGGSVRLTAARIDLRSYAAPGGRGGNGNDAVAGNGGDGGDGLVLIE